MKKINLLYLLVIFLIEPAIAQTVEKITEATNDFIHSLNQEELQKIQLRFENDNRVKWTNFPIGMAERKGILLGELSSQSKIKFHHVLTTLLSSQGYLKTTSILHLEDVLNVIFKQLHSTKEIDEKTYNEIVGLRFDYGNFYIAFWGKPDPIEPWGLKFEGHHLSINLSVVGNNFSLTPFFIGSDPAEVTNTKYAGLRVLSKEEDYGLKLINALSPSQQKIATLSKAVPKDIITNPNSPQMITDYQGIKGSDLNKEQQFLLERLIKEYIYNLEHEKAEAYINKLKKTGLDNIYFAWIGSYEIRKSNYYVINGPDFLIEYDNAGFLDNGNHIHAIWREKGNDFGEDLLKKHYAQHKH